MLALGLVGFRLRWAKNRYMYLVISSLLLFWSLINILETHLAETEDIPKMSVKIDWTASKLYAHFAGYISQVSPPVTHNQTVHNLIVFISGSLFGVPRLFIIFNALPPLPKLSSPFLHCAIRRRLLPKVLHIFCLKALRTKFDLVFK